MESPTETKDDHLEKSLRLRKGFTLRHSFSLSMLTLSFVVGEISHFLIGVVSQEMARSLHYGDKVCNLQHHKSQSNLNQSTGRTNAECEKFSIDSCHMHQGETWQNEYATTANRTSAWKSILKPFFLVLLKVREGTKSAKIARCKKLTAKVYSRLFIAGFLQLKRAFLSKLPLNFLKLKNYFNFYVLLCTLIHSNARNRLQAVSNQIL